MTFLTAAGIDEKWLRTKAPQLAWDIVAQIDGAAKLATGMYGLTPEQWEWLRTSEYFTALVTTTAKELSGPAGTVEIAKRKAALALEQRGILDLAGILADEKAPGPARVAAFKELRETAGITNSGAAAVNPNAGTAGFGGPLVVINLPARGVLSIGAIVPPEAPAAIEGSAERIA